MLIKLILMPFQSSGPTLPASVAAYPNLAKVFVKFAEDDGWRLIETLHLQLSKMVGLKHIGKNAFKSEPVYVFKKK